jgi:hypothetical protein
MMNKYRFHIATIIILLLIALLLYRNTGRSTLGRHTSAFAVSDTGRVTGISIDDGTSKIVLTREKNDKWSLNSSYEPSGRAVEMLLQTLTRLRISSPAPRSVSNELREKQWEGSLRLEIREGRRSHTYFVYSAGLQEPTYMRDAGDSRIWEMEVVGFGGNVASLFIADEGFWRSNILFSFRPADIAEVIVVYTGQDDDSFMLRQSADRQVSLFSYPEVVQSEGIDDSLAVRYLSGFMHVPFERFAGADENLLIDSLRSAGPDYFIRVTGHDGKVAEVRLHRIRTDNNPDNGNPEFDIFRLHAIVNDGREMVIVPWHLVDLILRSYSYFYQDGR